MLHQNPWTSLCNVWDWSQLMLPHVVKLWEHQSMMGFLLPHVYSCHKGSAEYHPFLVLVVSLWHFQPWPKTIIVPCQPLLMCGQTNTHVHDLPRFQRIWMGRRVSHWTILHLRVTTGKTFLHWSSKPMIALIHDVPNQPKRVVKYG